MHQTNPDTFCIGPWSEIRIHSDGSFNYCHTSAKNTSVHENVSRMTPMQFFHESTSWAGVNKQAMKFGKPGLGCDNCYQSEKHGVISHRLRRNLQSGIFPGADFPQSFSESDISSKINNTDIWPRFYHVSFSNLCNLGCIMCKPENSSYLSADFQKIGIISEVPRLDWTQGPGWKHFCDHILSNPDIVCLHIMGGEPLYHKKFHDLINLLCERDHTDFALTFVTNGTIFNTELIQKLKKFRSVQIEVSLEGVTDSNDYIRYPSKTSTIKHHVMQYLQHRTETFDVVIRTVPQVLSVLDYHELLYWCQENHLVVDSNEMYQPDFMHASMLPEHLKQQVRDNLKSFTDVKAHSVKNINVRDRHDIDRALAINADFVIKQMDKSISAPEQKWQRLIEYCDKLSVIRGMTLEQQFPQLADIVKSYR